MMEPGSFLEGQHHTELVCIGLRRDGWAMTVTLTLSVGGSREGLCGSAR